MGPQTLKVACPRQLDGVVKLRLGEGVDRPVFHDHATIVR